MRIRDLEKEDLEALVRLERESFFDPWNMQMLSSLLFSPYDITRIAEEEGEVIAYFNIRILGEEAELMRIAVRKEKRKSGMASLLMDQLLSLCKKRGAKRISLEVRESNEAAIRLYQKHGFSECGLRKEYYQMPAESALIMEYKIC